MVILAADLGGTRSRFALYSEKAGALEEKTFLELPSGMHDFAGLLRTLLRLWPGGAGELMAADAVSLAAAGAVSGGRIRMTNACCVADADVVSSFFPGARVLLMNDFEAQALGCLAGQGRFLESLHGDACAVLRDARSGKEKRPVAVLGAGTGLGAAWLAGDACGRMGVLPSEAGHVPFPFHGGEELAFAAFLAERCGEDAVTAEQVLSGRGLASLHEYLSGRGSSPEEFTIVEGFADSDCCRLFARFYGRFCRMAAYFLLPCAIVVTGGVAGRSPCLVRHPEFLQEFWRRGNTAPRVLESIPLALNTNSRSGLLGAACAALVRAAPANLLMD